MTSIAIKKGQLIYLNHIAIDRSVDVWGPDAAEFKPERWLPDELKTPGLGVSPMPRPGDLTQGWAGIFAFLQGPRTCLGIRLALLQYKMMVSSVVKAFELSADVDAGSGGRIETYLNGSTILTPYVVGRREDGVQVPLKIRPV